MAEDHKRHAVVAPDAVGEEAVRKLVEGKHPKLDPSTLGRILPVSWFAYSELHCLDCDRILLYPTLTGPEKTVPAMMAGDDDLKAFGGMCYRCGEKYDVEQVHARFDEEFNRVKRANGMPVT